jgi:hypothetical protein
MSELCGASFRGVPESKCSVQKYTVKAKLIRKSAG